jgi:hypothetical protein
MGPLIEDSSSEGAEQAYWEDHQQLSYPMAFLSLQKGDGS